LTGGDKGEGDMFSFENLYHCYLKCRKHKRGTINALKFEINAEENLFKLSEELENKTYQPSRSVCFVVERPKMREIIAADFKDRVVHHLLVKKLEAVYEPIFIHDSYACRKGKGLHKAVERVREFIRRGSKNGRERLYFLHLDIKNFFMTIDKNLLYRMIEKKLHKKISPTPSLLKRGIDRGSEDFDLLKKCCQSVNSFEKGGFYDDIFWLARVIIFHNPIENCIIKGKRHLIKSLPPHKSLFQASENRGLPVGNLTSQFFANVYLNELDQFVKHNLKCRYYVRYCDDFLILDESPERLKEIRERIREFVTERLNLSLNDRYQSVLPVSNGIDFLGYIIRQDYSLVRRRVVNNLKSKLNWFKERLVEGCHSREGGNPEKRRLDAQLSLSPQVVSWEHSDMTNAYVCRYDYELFERLRATIASYWGHLKWADSYNLRNSILKHYEFLKEFLSFEQEAIKPLFKFPALFSSVQMQYCYYKDRFKDAVVFFQVGSFYEFYGRICDALGTLKNIPSNKRGALYGFPMKLQEQYMRKVLSKGLPVVLVHETGMNYGRIKERLPVMKILPRCGSVKIKHKEGFI
jgi:hypothetical protein